MAVIVQIILQIDIHLSVNPTVKLLLLCSLSSQFNGPFFTLFQVSLEQAVATVDLSSKAI